MRKITVALIICALLSGCMFIGLNEDVKQLEASISISGNIENPGEAAAPIVVTLSRSEGGKNTLHNYTVVYGSSNFLLPAPEGNYYLLAFEDVNQDFTLQENERAGWYGKPSLIEAIPGQAHSGIVITLKEPEKVKQELPILFAPGKSHEPVNLEKTKLGEVVDQSVFRQELGPLGMWSPVQFHLQGHSGVFFLEPYSAEKLPVIFVHGISGSGHDWLYLVDQLDRDHVQPWIVQYPSGMRLDSISRYLSQSVNELRATYDFERFAVIAHSMGGLVARGFINHQTSAAENGTDITAFVTISTPWLGHDALSKGPQYAPVAVPAWFDIVPGSPFLSALHEQSLSDKTSYYLLFGHKGEGAGVFKRYTSDGTVSLRSQLSMNAQEEAVRVRGFDENHAGILKSRVVSEHLNKILKEN